MSYDPKTLKNNQAYRHEVEAAEIQQLKFLPKRVPQKEVKKPTITSMHALVDRFKKF